MRSWFTCGGLGTAALVAAMIAGSGHAQPKPAAADLKQPTVMQRKLGHAQKILAAIAVEDFHQLRLSAEGLRECVKDETWRINDTEKYLMHSDDFLRQCDALRDAAKKKNADAASLAYLGMTLSCVNCHRHLRDERMGKQKDKAD